MANCYRVYYLWDKISAVMRAGMYLGFGQGVGKGPQAPSQLGAQGALHRHRHRQFIGAFHWHVWLLQPVVSKTDDDKIQYKIRDERGTYT